MSQAASVNCHIKITDADENFGLYLASGSCHKCVSRVTVIIFNWLKLATQNVVIWRIVVE